VEELKGGDQRKGLGLLWRNTVFVKGCASWWGLRECDHEGAWTVDFGSKKGAG
jgi:hypothetical protein